MWAVERTASKGDYTYAVVLNHPNRTKDNYVLLHRIVMENFLGRLLTKDEVVHHKDENKKNNAIENLELMSKSDHVRHHNIEKGNARVKTKCPNCNVDMDIGKGQFFIQKGCSFTACSPRCRGQYSRKIQMKLLEHAAQDFIEYQCFAKLV
jgi:hypothetical protein